ncbi:MAG: GDP-mannose 4,6-dehydratase [Candidatus Shapirobacteria bacterium]
MNEEILVCGGNGYIGNALVQRLLFLGYSVVCIDNDLKEKWAQELGSISAIPTISINDKVKKFNKINKFKHYRADIAKEPDQIRKIFKKHKFKTIVNLAQQPSAAYSQISLKHSSETLTNNNIGTLNLLWIIKETNPDIHYIEIESMGCNQPDININIPEGLFTFDFNGRTSKPSIFPKRPGSFYHSSKVNNTYLVDCAARFWNLRITAINQGIVYGGYTPEIEQTEIFSPMWCDECFGTVVHRFIIQTLLKEELLVYGLGSQRRGFLSLNDSVQCLQLFIENEQLKSGEVRFVNQLDEVYTIREIAGKVINTLGKEYIIKYIESPRVECTEEFFYNPITDTLKSFGFEQTRTIEDEVKFCADNVMEDLSELKVLMGPKVNWRNKC